MQLVVENRLRTFVIFGMQQALSCLFPATVFALLALSHQFTWLMPRYDFMLITCLLVQIVLYRSGIESKDEVRVICVFHLHRYPFRRLEIFLSTCGLDDGELPQDQFVGISGDCKLYYCGGIEDGEGRSQA